MCTVSSAIAIRNPEVAELTAEHTLRRRSRTAARQHGLITRAQLRALGLSRDIIDNRVKSRRLRRFRRGVYLIGPTTPPLAPEMGAILSCP